MTLFFLKNLNYFFIVTLLYYTKCISVFSASSHRGYAVSTEVQGKMSHTLSNGNIYLVIK